MIELYLCWNDNEPNATWLSKCEDSGDKSRKATSNDMTEKLLSEYLDMDAESDNYHHLVGAYSWLSKIIKRVSDETVAKRVLLAIAKQGGLQNVGT